MMTQRWQILDCQPCHIRALSRSMRAEDRAEIEILGAMPRRELWRSFRTSLVARAALVDGEIAAAWGVCGPLFAPVGVAWLLTAPPVERVPLACVRVGRQETREMLAFFPTIANRVHAPYERAVRFMRLLGFDVGEPEPFGPQGAPFRLVTMTRS